MSTRNHIRSSIVVQRFSINEPSVLGKESSTSGEANVDAVRLAGFCQRWIEEKAKRGRASHFGRENHEVMLVRYALDGC